jgi:hypothetical protein
VVGQEKPAAQLGDLGRWNSQGGSKTVFFCDQDFDLIWKGGQGLMRIDTGAQSACDQTPIHLKSY